MAAGLREEVDFLQDREPRLSLRLAWSAFHAVGVAFPRSFAVKRHADFVTAEELFIALDGRGLSAAGTRYRVEVFSVRDEAGQRWAQLALNSGESRRLLTIRLKQGDTAQHAIHLLASWLADPSSATNVFNVA